MSETVNLILGLSILAVFFAGLWKSFEKAGIEGWKSLIPLYNIYLVVKIAGLSGWMLLGFLIPLVNILIPIYVYYRFAKNYGKGPFFGIFTGLMPYFGVPILGFDSSTYKGSYQVEEDDLA